MKNIIKIGLAGLVGYILLKKKSKEKTSTVPVNLEKKTPTVDSLKKQWLTGKITMMEFQRKVSKVLGR